MYYIAESQDKNGRTLLGSEHTQIIRLKTLRGAIQRVKNCRWSKRTERVVIARLDDEDRRYDPTAYKYVYSVGRGYTNYPL